MLKIILGPRNPGKESSKTKRPHLRVTNSSGIQVSTRCHQDIDKVNKDFDQQDVTKANMMDRYFIKIISRQEEISNSTPV